MYLQITVSNFWTCTQFPIYDKKSYFKNFRYHVLHVCSAQRCYKAQNFLIHCLLTNIWPVSGTLQYRYIYMLFNRGMQSHSFQYNNNKTIQNKSKTIPYKRPIPAGSLGHHSHNSILIINILLYRIMQQEIFFFINDIRQPVLVLSCFCSHQHVQFQRRETPHNASSRQNYSSWKTLVVHTNNENKILTDTGDLARKVKYFDYLLADLTQ